MIRSSPLLFSRGGAASLLKRTARTGGISILHSRTLLAVRQSSTVGRNEEKHAYQYDSLHNPSKQFIQLLVKNLDETSLGKVSLSLMKIASRPSTASDALRRFERTVGIHYQHLPPYFDRYICSSSPSSSSSASQTISSNSQFYGSEEEVMRKNREASIPHDALAAMLMKMRINNCFGTYSILETHLKLKQPVFGVFKELPEPTHEFDKLPKGLVSHRDNSFVSDKEGLNGGENIMAQGTNHRNQSHVTNSSQSHASTMTLSDKDFTFDDEKSYALEFSSTLIDRLPQPVLEQLIRVLRMSMDEQDKINDTDSKNADMKLLRRSRLLSTWSPKNLSKLVNAIDKHGLDSDLIYEKYFVKDSTYAKNQIKYFAELYLTLKTEDLELEPKLFNSSMFDALKLSNASDDLYNYVCYSERRHHLRALVKSLGHHWIEFGPKLCRYLRVYDSQAELNCPFKKEYDHKLNSIETELKVALSLLRGKFISANLMEVEMPLPKLSQREETTSSLKDRPSLFSNFDQDTSLNNINEDLSLNQSNRYLLESYAMVNSSLAESSPSSSNSNRIASTLNQQEAVPPFQGEGSSELISKFYGGEEGEEEGGGGVTQALVTKEGKNKIVISNDTSLTIQGLKEDRSKSAETIAADIELDLFQKRSEVLDKISETFKPPLQLLSQEQLLLKEEMKVGGASVHAKMNEKVSIKSRLLKSRMRASADDVALVEMMKDNYETRSEEILLLNKSYKKINKLNRQKKKRLDKKKHQLVETKNAAAAAAAASSSDDVSGEVPAKVDEVGQSTVRKARDTSEDQYISPLFSSWFTTNTILVKNLRENVTKHDLAAAFERCGKIRSIRFFNRDDTIQDFSFHHDFFASNSVDKFGSRHENSEFEGYEKEDREEDDDEEEEEEEVESGSTVFGAEDGDILEEFSDASFNSDQKRQKKVASKKSSKIARSKHNPLGAGRKAGVKSVIAAKNAHLFKESEVYALVEFHDEESYEKASSQALQTFGICIDGEGGRGLGGGGGMSRITPAIDLKSLYIYVVTGSVIASELESWLNDLLVPHLFSSTLKSSDTGVSLLSEASPHVVQLECPSHDAAQWAFNKMAEKDVMKRPFPLDDVNFAVQWLPIKLDTAKTIAKRTLASMKDEEGEEEAEGEGFSDTTTTSSHVSHIDEANTNSHSSHEFLDLMK